MKRNRIEGLEKVTAELTRAVEKIANRSRGGLLAGGWQIMRQAMINAPVEFQELRRSGRARFVPEGENLVELIFTKEYAAVQHENMEFKHPRGGGPKYLENAIVSEGPKALRTIAADAKKGVRK